MHHLKSLAQKLYRLTSPRPTPGPVEAISESYCHFCESCRCYVKIMMWEMDTCPNCGSTDIKYAAMWMRTPGEQAARRVAHARPRFVKSINGGMPKPLPQRVVVVTPPTEAP